MIIARNIRNLSKCTVGQNYFRNYRISSTNYEANQTAQPQVKEERFSFEDVKVLERTERRKPPIPPFIKDVMVSVFNRDLLAYPEILNKEEYDDLERRINKLNSVFTNEENTQKERLDVTKQCGLFAAPLNLTNNGLAMNVTERIRYLETISPDFSLGKRLSDHWVGLQALRLGLTEDNFQKLVSDLTSGEKTISLCCKELMSTRVKQADFRTTAQLDENSE